MEILLEILLRASEVDRQINLYDVRCAEILMNHRDEIKAYEEREKKKIIFNQLAVMFDEINEGKNNEER